MSKDTRSLIWSLIFLIFGMLFLTYSSSSIYNIFCKATGTGGTVLKSETGSFVKGTRKITIRFDANIEEKLPWKFYPKQREVLITTGENNLVFYEAKNLSNKNIVGTAVYNVTPFKAGKYFNKIECFCFQEQLLSPGSQVLMPVSFFIDPEFDNDSDMRDVNTITLSYSFFLIREEQ